MTATRRSRWPLPAWLLGLLAAATLLRTSAGGALAPPPIDSLDELLTWAETRPPATLAIALVRAVAEVATWYLLVVSVLHAGATVLRIASGHRVADAITLPWIRRAVHAALGLGVAASSAIAIRGPAVTAPTDRVEVAMPVSVRTPVDPDGSGTAVMRAVVAAPAEITTEGGTARMVPAASTWTVAEGESFWSIAEETLAQAWGRPVTDGEVAPYWRRVIEVNRSRLVDPDDPDLIHPGQRFDLPTTHP